jgi:hypothetical protein
VGQLGLLSAGDLAVVESEVREREKKAPVCRVDGVAVEVVDGGDVDESGPFVVGQDAWLGPRPCG